MNACHGYSQSLLDGFKAATKPPFWFAGSQIELGHDEAFLLAFLVLRQILAGGKSLMGAMTDTFKFPGVTGSYRVDAS